ncbi:bifunctional metallophosphatase/5'-nucleotidase [Motilibacter aurantiacus]|uniref:bifunctional metallophosphatase/5'-nucleotidase n=1 Tax=Motilibacter aurantiacus TaxID=2714955 RepID=UPI00140AF5AA|nr:bifunctional metallophosphatase/5'-nucleotidase [Motilibacter aurantiacus]NHC46864.1 bifunctional metallophosphatase/5'-nucleotidase [Motilibacter aurantiacus]
MTKPSERCKRLLAVAAAGGALAAAVTAAVPASAASAPIQRIQLLAFNDFHGNLEPPSGSGGRIQTGTSSTGAAVNVDAGGAAYLSTHLKALRAGERDSFTVSSGDLIGASPLLSAAFHDEPTIEAHNLMDVDLGVVGNHEFDEGVAELLRIQKGGCIRDGEGANNQNSCPAKDLGGKRFRGADFPYLAANVEYTATGRTILSATHVEKFHQGAKVGFIGVVTKTTPSIVTASGVAGLTFTDEADTINRYAAQLQAQGVQAIVAVIHEGGSQAGLYNACSNLNGAVLDLNNRISPSVDVLLNAHTHAGYNCKLNDPAGNPRVVVQGASAGRLISEVDLAFDRRTGDINRAQTTATNHVVTRTVPADPAITGLIARYQGYLGPIASRELGSISADLVRATSPAGEAPLSNVLADAAKADASVQGNGPVEIGFINPGGVRADLPFAPDGVVQYGEAFSVQPFSNYNVSKTLKGSDLKAVLEQQFDNPGAGQNRILGVSGLTYSWSDSAPKGSKVSNVLVNGQPLDLSRSYRVAGNNFLLEGGDNFTAFAQGTAPLYGGLDIEAFASYLEANSPLAPPALDRITRLP